MSIDTSKIPFTQIKGNGLSDNVLNERFPLTVGTNPIFIGTLGNDYLTGTEDDDIFLGLWGNDTLLGLSGNDLIFGGVGEDLLEGGSDDGQ